jgi:hypothetical protein
MTLLMYRKLQVLYSFDSHMFLILTWVSMILGRFSGTISWLSQKRGLREICVVYTHVRKNYEVRWHAVDHEEPRPNVRDRWRDRTSHGDSGTWPTFLFKRSMSRCRISTAFPDLNISRISPTFMGKCLILHYLSWKRTVANDRQSHRLWSYHGDLGTWFTTFLLWRQQVRFFFAEYDLFICAISISGG